MFRAKGLVFLGARDYYEGRVPGGCAAVRARLAPDMATYFDQRFLSGGWYDVMPILAITAAAAKACGASTTELASENAAWLAQRDLRGIYRLIVSVAMPEMIASRLPELSLRYFDFGHAEGKMIGDRLFESHRHGIPEPLAAWFAAVTRGFVPVALESAGARSVTVRASRREDDGVAHGVPLTRTRFEIGWE